MIWLDTSCPRERGSSAMRWRQLWVSLAPMEKYRVYLRWPGQRTSDSTTTEIEDVAKFAFEYLKARSDLKGKHVAVALTRDSRQQDYFDFRTGDP
jgi:hypothetical protein